MKGGENVANAGKKFEEDIKKKCTEKSVLLPIEGRYSKLGRTGKYKIPTK